MTKIVKLTDEKITNKIFLIRGKKVMLDRDLAEMYGVTTGNLNKAVKRNLLRFPKDFMFRLTKDELRSWIFQFGTSNRETMGLRKLPLAFTEQGVAMLSGVLKSKTAIRVNIQIIRVFAKMREMLIAHKDILLKLEQIELKLLKHDGSIEKHEREIQTVFIALKQLLNPKISPKKRIGYRLANEND